MAQYVTQFTASIPANTAQAAPVTVVLPIDNASLERLDLSVPPGPAGLMGFHIARSGQQVLPQGAGEWIVWDDYTDSWYLEDQSTAQGWQVVGYNLDGVNAHAVIVRFHWNPPSPARAVPVVNVSFASSPQPAAEFVLG